MTVIGSEAFLVDEGLAHVRGEDRARHHGVDAEGFQARGCREIGGAGLYAQCLESVSQGGHMGV